MTSAFAVVVSIAGGTAAVAGSALTTGPPSLIVETLRTDERSLADEVATPDEELDEAVDEPADRSRRFAGVAGSLRPKTPDLLNMIFPSQGMQR
jgi:hypothetical protein